MIASVGLKTRSIISHRVPNRAVQREVKKLATRGGILFASGFVLWNIDREICPSLTAFKRQIGMPWSFVFELHGWWHVLTGIGAYICA
jgi:dihydroceramidase